MKPHQEEDEKPRETEPRAWYRQPDFLIGAVIAVILWLAASWFVNDPSSPRFWRSFP